MELSSSSTAGSTSSTSTATAELPEKPHQPPGFRFPPRSFGKKKVVHRAFSKLVGFSPGRGYTMTKGEIMFSATTAAKL